MPRKPRPTLAGAPGQAVGPVAGQQYGAGVEQMALQQAMPAPDARAGETAAPSGAGGGMDAGPAADTAPVPTQPSEAERYQHALQAAQAMKGQPGMLSASARPGEPVTTGMPFGPGGGPEVLGMRPRGHPTGNLMRQLANATGDTYLRDLVERAGL